MKEEILNILDTEFIGKNIVFYNSVDSTNLRAKENPGEPEGTVFLADFQECGRGRMTRQWESEEKSGIYMSILLKPEISPERLSGITQIAGICVAVALEKLFDLPGAIKWPNDIVIGGKKVCGILCEFSKPSVIVGIGVNVNNKSFSKELMDKATSVFMETGKEACRSKLTAKILEEFERIYQRFLEGGFSEILEEYKKRCITLGKDVEIITPVSSYRARAVDIAPDGALVVEHKGKKEYINSGEVSVRGILGYV